MQYRVLFFVLVFVANVFGQEVKKENQTKKVTFYWDYAKTQVQAQGKYYKDELGETTKKHGKWEYFNKEGVLVEVSTYYRDELNGPVLLFYGNAKPKQEGYFKMGKQDSVYREWYESGKLNVEGYYREDRPIGNWTTCYLDGRTQKVEEYIDSTIYLRSFFLPDSAHTQTIVAGTGEYITYFNSGTLKEWYNYKNGIQHGAFEERSINGYLLLSGSFDNGEKTGEWKYYYYTGDLEKVSNYEKGKLHGKYQYFYDNGQLNVEGFYEQGKKSGLWTWYTNQGKRDQAGTFMDDMQDGDWTFWYPTGELSYTAKFSKNAKTGTWSYYYKDGSKFKIGQYQQDQKHGLWQTWYENGTLLMEGSYHAGKEQGLWSNYWENGTLKNQSTFKAGVLHGAWKSFWPDGTLKLTGYYKNGHKNKEWIDYFVNGKPKDIITYKVIKHKSAVKYGPLKNHVTYESVKHGKFVSFSDKDYKMTEAGTYKMNEKEGQWTAYYPGARIPAVVSSYKKGLLDGPMLTYDRKGILMTEVNYKAGVKHGKFKTFDKKGKVLTERDYENGEQVIKERKQSGGGFTPR